MNALRSVPHSFIVDSSNVEEVSEEDAPVRTISGKIFRMSLNPVNRSRGVSHYLNVAKPV